MRSTLWVFAWALTLTLAGCGTTQEQRKDQAQARWDLARNKVYCRLAQDAYDAGNLNQCKRQLGKILTSEQPYPPAYLLAARVAMREQRFDEASEYVDLLVRITPDLADVWYAKGLLAEQAGDLDAALEDVMKAQKLNPSEAEYLLCVAELQVRRGEPDRALATLTAVEDRFNVHAGVQSALADLHMMMGDYDSAARCLRRLARIDSQDAQNRERLGLCLARSGQAEQAIPLLESVTEKVPTASVAARSELARCYVQLGEHVKAEGVYARLCAEQPRSPTWNYCLAECLAARHQDLTALERLDRVFELAPSHADAHALAGYLHYARGELETAEEHLRIAIDRIDDPTLVAVALTRTLHDLGRDEEAEEVWAEFGQPVELAKSSGVTGAMTTASSSAISLTGQMPRGAVKR